MASEIEIIACREISFSPKDLCTLFEKEVQEAAVPHLAQHIHKFRIGTQEISGQEKLSEKSSGIHFFDAENNKYLLLYGPCHEVNNDFHHAQELIEKPHFSEDLIPSIVSKADAINCSYYIRWSINHPTIDFFVLALCKLLDGIILNDQTNHIDTGTYLYADWKETILKYWKQ
jgi:hypothetical protein